MRYNRQHHVRMRQSDIPAPARAAWRGDTLRFHDCVRTLKPSERAALTDAVRGIDACASKWLTLSKSDFRYEALGSCIAEISENLEERGFVILRGMPMELSLDELKAAYWGIGMHLGKIVPQNQFNDRLTEVSNPANPLPNRGYTGNHKLNPHCDPIDIIGLFSVRKARLGGESTIVSSGAVYNAILKDHPEYLDVFYRGFIFERKRAGLRPHPLERIPVFWRDGDKLRCRFNYNWICDGASLANIELTDLEREAIACFLQTACGPGVPFNVLLEPGDILMLNNKLALHARNAFEDWDEPNRGRLLLRIWVNTFRSPSDYVLRDRYGVGDPEAAYIY